MHSIRSPALSTAHPFKTVAPAPQHGDQIGFNGTTYVVEEVEADIGGGAVLKLRTL